MKTHDLKKKSTIKQKKMSVNLLKDETIAPLFRRIYNQDLSDLLPLIPDEYKEQKDKILASYATYQSLLEEMSTMQSSMSTSLTSQMDAFQQLQNDYQQWTQYDQFLFDNQVQQYYIRGLNNTSSNLSFFSDWYLSQLQKQSQETIQKLNKTYLQILVLLDRELKLKQHVSEYQQHITMIQEQWYTMVSEQIQDQTKTLRQLQDVQFTSKRKKEIAMERDDLFMKSSQWLFYMFFFLVLLHVLLLAKYFWTRSPKK